MARSPFSLIRAMCTYRVEACFVAAFVFMLLHDAVGVRRVVVHTTTTSVVRHEIGRHEHARDRRSRREMVRMPGGTPVRVAAPRKMVHVTPGPTARKVRIVEPARSVRVAPRPRRVAATEPTLSRRVSPPSPAVGSVKPPREVRASGGTAVAGGARTRHAEVPVLVPGTPAVTF